jgi:DnaJ-class molecular chaperone
MATVEGHAHTEQSLYETLEVDSDSSLDELTEAWKTQLLAWHPDRFPKSRSAAATERTKRINHAYSVLSDNEARAKYDESIGVSRAAARGAEDAAAEHVLWPTSPGDADIRAVLQAWASKKRFVSDDAFEGELKVSDASLCRFTIRRMVETRTTSSVQQAINHGLPTARYGGDLGSIHVPAPTGFKSATFHSMLNGSERELPCSKCGGQGWIPCRWCQNGYRMVTRTDAQGRQSTGQEMCMACFGKGKNKCSGTCRGTGRVVSFTMAAIDQKPTLFEGGEEPSSEIGRKWLSPSRLSEWRGFGPFSGEALPTGMCGTVASKMAARLGDRPNGERLRRLDVVVLPVTKVEYSHAGLEAVAYVVGKSRNVIAVPPGTRKRQFQMAIIMLVTIGTLLGLAVGLNLLLAN